MERLSRGVGCLLGQLAGDSLGALVEFKTPQRIRMEYPHGVRELTPGGTWGLLAGQPTDDSEMALMLARMLVEQGTYDDEAALRGYRSWLASGPFDCGTTTRRGLTGKPDPDSQANGSLMRISPLGIFGACHSLEKVAEWAMLDASLTHPHRVCQWSAALFAMGIAFAIDTGASPRTVYDQILSWAESMNVDATLLKVVQDAEQEPPEDFMPHQGWVLIALQNALWQLLHAETMEHGICDTVMRGGDTDTNAAICGALLGAVYGEEAIPHQWRDAILSCRPRAGEHGVRNPRPECFWPVDAPQLALRLLGWQG